MPSSNQAEEVAEAGSDQSNHAAPKDVRPLPTKRLARKSHRISGFTTEIPPEQAQLREDMEQFAHEVNDYFDDVNNQINDSKLVANVKFREITNQINTLDQKFDQMQASIQALTDHVMASKGRDKAANQAQKPHTSPPSETGISAQYKRQTAAMRDVSPPQRNDSPPIQPMARAESNQYIKSDHLIGQNHRDIPAFQPNNQEMRASAPPTRYRTAFPEDLAGQIHEETSGYRYQDRDISAFPRDIRQTPGGTYQSDSGQRFRPSDIGYFDPRLDQSHGPGDVITVGQETYYRDVFLFLDQAKMVASLKGSDIVRHYLFQCLRGTALNWYTCELDHARKNQLKEGPDIQQWETALASRFRLDEHEALMLLHKESYSLEDVKNRRSLANYVQSVVRLGRSTNWTMLNSLNWAYTNLAGQLQRDISRPTSNSSVEDFIRSLEAKESAWRACYNWESKGSGYYQNQARFGSTYLPEQRQSRQQYSKQEGQYYSKQDGRNIDQKPPPSNGYRGFQQPRDRVPPPQGTQNEPRQQPRNQLDRPNNAYFGEEEGEEGVPAAYYGTDEDTYAFFNDSDQSQRGIPPFSCQRCMLSCDTSNSLRNHVMEEHQIDCRQPSAISNVRAANRAHAAIQNAVLVAIPPAGYATVKGKLFDN